MTPKHKRQHLLAVSRFEVVPVPGALDQLAALPPGVSVTVTASPRRGVEQTVAFAEAAAARGFSAVPHLAARQITDEAQLGDILGRLHGAGVRDLFVVGGDARVPAGDFPDGLSLLKAIDTSGYRFDAIGVPSYPEGHPLIDDDSLWWALAAKQPYATYTVTQLCLDADTIVRHGLLAQARGIILPIVVGIPGAVPASKLLRMSLRVGIGDSIHFLRGNRSALRRLLTPRAYRPDALLRGLANHPAGDDAQLAGLHIYTFNEIATTVRWLARARRGGSR